jgi:outer membrane protein OmpA-like peptidoglycan-associated protein
VASMKRSARRRCWPVGWALGVWLGGAPEASAQTLAGWALDRYEPSAPGDAFFLAELPWYRGARTVAVGLTLDYAANPLGLRIPRDGLPPVDQAVVSGMLTGHLGVAFAPLDRLGIHLSFPVALAQSGSAIPSGAGNLGPSMGVAPGDLRAGLRVRLVGDAERDPWSLHLGALLWIPTGSPADNTGDGSFRFEPRVVLAGRASRLRWSMGAGLHLRSAVSALNLAVGHELRVTAALGLALLRDRLHVGPEASLFSSVRDLPSGRGSAAFKPGQWGVEVMLGARWRVADAVQVGLAGGIGIGEGYGVPEGRALLSLVYAPVSRPSAARRERPLMDAPRLDPAPVPVVTVTQPTPTSAVPTSPVPTSPVPTDASALAALSGGFVRTLEPVDFRAHRARISGVHSFRVLDAVAALLRSRPDLEVDVQVHTGHRSNPAFYRELSEQRAMAVRAYLVERGVPPARLQSHGMGAACLDPARSRHSSGGDAPRLQLVILTPDLTGGRCVRQDASGSAPEERARGEYERE